MTQANEDVGEPPLRGLLRTPRQRIAYELCRFANGTRNCFCSTGKAKMDYCDKIEELIGRIETIQAEGGSP